MHTCRSRISSTCARQAPSYHAGVRSSKITVHPIGRISGADRAPQAEHQRVGSFASAPMILAPAVCEFQQELVGQLQVPIAA